jgi:putative glutamine amidotransferase
MPLIGIAPSSHTADYESSIHRAGADFRVLDTLHDDPARVVREIDGLLLTGGNDVDPALFGESPHTTYHRAEVGRDDHEVALARQAFEAKLPIFAICRGLQVLNVAFGGTLVQDIPTAVATAVTHLVPMPKYAMAHEVWVNRGSVLWTLMEERLENGDTLAVNSRHHQAVREVAPGFVVSATAPDGVIEAIERPGDSFCIGVQWHPENFWRTGEFRPLFEGFIEACRQ